jgi:hypothetical protein
MKFMEFMDNERPYSAVAIVEARRQLAAEI